MPKEENMIVETYEMKKGLNTLKSAVGTKSPVEAMHCVMLDATSGELFLVGTNGQVTIKTKVGGEVKVEEAEKMLIPFTYLHEIVSNTSSLELSIELDKNVAKIKGGTSKFKLNTLKATDFPDVIFEAEGEEFSMPTLDLVSYIDKTLFAISQKDYRAVLKGVNLSSTGKELTLVATDSYRLSRIEIPTEAGKFNVTIPGDTLKMMKNVFGNAEEVSIKVGKANAIFKTEDTIMNTALLAGAYPDVERLIPYSFNTTVTFNRLEMISCLGRASMFKNDNIAIIKLDVTDSISVSSKNAELGEFNEVVNAKVEGDPFKIAFSASYIVDALKALDTEEVKFCFQADMKPFTLVNVGENTKNVLELALPVKTYN